MNELKLNNDHELRFSVRLLRQIIATEQRRVRTMIEGYTPDLSHPNLPERLDDLQEWFQFVFPDREVEVRTKTNPKYLHSWARVKIRLSPGEEGEDDREYLKKLVQKIFPDFAVVNAGIPMPADEKPGWVYKYTVYVPAEDSE
jgi:hypothetical protein